MIMFFKHSPKYGDLRYEVQPIYTKGKKDLKHVKTERTLQYYSGVAWRDIPEFYKPMIEI